MVIDANQLAAVDVDNGCSATIIGVTQDASGLVRRIRGFAYVRVADIMYGMTREGVLVTVNRSTALTTPVLGMAQGAVDVFEEQVMGGVAYTTGDKLGENPAVHIRLSEAEAEIHSARLIMKNDGDELFGQVRRGEMPSINQRARFRRNQAYVARLSTRAVDRLFEGSGGHVLFNSNPMQRCHRDAHAASHHFGIHWETQAEEYGRVRLGLELKNPGRI